MVLIQISGVVDGACYDDEPDTVSMIMSVTSVIKSGFFAAKEW